MAPRRPHTARIQQDQATSEPGQQHADRLKQAQEELARMEETQRVCFRYQNDLKKLADELRQRKYSDFDITYLLEPKGPRKIPGYQLSDMARQRKFVGYLQEPAKPAESHADAVDQSRQPEDEMAR